MEQVPIAQNKPPKSSCTHLSFGLLVGLRRQLPLDHVHVSFAGSPVQGRAPELRGGACM